MASSHVQKLASAIAICDDECFTSLMDEARTQHNPIFALFVPFVFELDDGQFRGNILELCLRMRNYTALDALIRRFGHTTPSTAANTLSIVIGISDRLVNITDGCVDTIVRQILEHPVLVQRFLVDTHFSNPALSYGDMHPLICAIVMRRETTVKNIVRVMDTIDDYGKATGHVNNLLENCIRSNRLDIVRLICTKTLSKRINRSMMHHSFVLACRAKSEDIFNTTIDWFATLVDTEDEALDILYDFDTAFESVVEMETHRIKKLFEVRIYPVFFKCFVKNCRDAIARLDPYVQNYTIPISVARDANIASHNEFYRIRHNLYDKDDAHLAVRKALNNATICHDGFIRMIARGFLESESDEERARLFELLPEKVQNTLLKFIALNQQEFEDSGTLFLAIDLVLETCAHMILSGLNVSVRYGTMEYPQWLQAIEMVDKFYNKAEKPWKPKD